MAGCSPGAGELSMVTGQGPHQPGPIPPHQRQASRTVKASLKESPVIISSRDELTSQVQIIRQAHGDVVGPKSRQEPQFVGHSQDQADPSWRQVWGHIRMLVLFACMNVYLQGINAQPCYWWTWGDGAVTASLF